MTSTRPNLCANLTTIPVELEFLWHFEVLKLKTCSLYHENLFIQKFKATLQMFAGNYRDSTGKSECRDFKFMGIACVPAIPVIFKYPQSVIFAGNLIYRDSTGIPRIRCRETM